MASNTFDRLVDENIRALRGHRQDNKKNFAMEQSKRNTRRTRENKILRQERQDRRSERMEPVVQKYYNQGRMQGVGSGRKDPRQALLEISPNAQSLMLARPEAFGGGGQAGGRSGTTSRSGGTGIPGIDYDKAFSAAGDHMEALNDPAARANLPKEDAAGNPLTPEQAQAYVAEQRLQNQARIAGGIVPQQGRQVATMPESAQTAREESLKNRQHFDQNLMTSLVDEKGNPVDAGRAGEEGVYRKFTHQGRGADAGRDMRPPQESVTAVGFGDQRQEIQRQPASAVDRAITGVFGDVAGGGEERPGQNAGLSDEVKRRGRDTGAGQSGRDDLRQRAASAFWDEGEGKQEEAAKPRAKKQNVSKNEKTKRKQQGARQADEKPTARRYLVPKGGQTGRAPKQSVMGQTAEGFSLDVKKDDKPAVRSMKERLNKVLERERNPQKVKEEISNFLKWWDRTSSRNM